MSVDHRRAAEEHLASLIESREAACAVIGLGYIGSTLMEGLAHAGFRAHGFDRSLEAVGNFERWMGQRQDGANRRWTTAADPAALHEAQVIAVAVRALPRPDRSINMEPLESVAAVLRAYPCEPRLILLESTVPCGATRCFAGSLQAGGGVFVAHSPERLSAGDDREVFRRTPHLVGGVDRASGNLAALLLRAMCEHVVQVSSPEVSELSKLLENAFLATGIALSNEVTRIAHSLGIAAEEVCTAAATKRAGYYPFYPGPGMGGHCLGNDLAILQSAAERSGVSAPFLSAAAAAAAQGPQTVLRRFEKIVWARGRNLEGLRVLLVGVGFKPGTADTTGSPAQEIARLLLRRRAEVSYIDCLVPVFGVDLQGLPRVFAAELRPGDFDAAIVVAGDRTLPLDRIAACSDLVFDARGRSSEPRPDGVHTL